MQTSINLASGKTKNKHKNSFEFTINTQNIRHISKNVKIDSFFVFKITNSTPND